jgi:hypothetical protein
MASGWPGKGHGALLKKRLSARSALQETRKQVQNTTKTTYSAPYPGAQESAKEFFNTLGCSKMFGCPVRLLGFLY